MRKLTFALIAFSAALGCLYGILVMKSHIFPYHFIRGIYLSLKPIETLPKELVIDRTKLQARISSAIANSVNLRKQMLDRVILPKKMVTFERRVTEENREVINATMYGISINSVLSKSKMREGKCLRIYVHKHDGNPFDFDYHNELLDWSLRNGCDFLSMSMIGRGLNSSEASYPGLNGTVKLSRDTSRRHANYAFYRDAEYPQADPLALFLTLHYYTIKSLTSRYENVSLMGISGGGWYTVWLSALIPSIDVSISYAGSLPLEYRLYEHNGGDWEQVFSSVYREIDYWELYALMVVNNLGEKSRTAYLVYNNNDPCCFRDPYASHFKTVLDSINDPLPAVIVDDNDNHSMNVQLIQSILQSN